MFDQTTFIDTALLEGLSREAAVRPRRRVHHNFHPHADYPSHRLVVAIEPGSYIPPHCHADPAKDETLLVLRGRLGALLFDATGRVVTARILDAAEGCLGLTIPHGTFHSLLALEEGSAFLESKAGPYAAPEGEERPVWAPLEETPEAAAYLERLRTHFIP